MKDNPLAAVVRDNDTICLSVKGLVYNIGDGPWWRYVAPGEREAKLMTMAAIADGTKTIDRGLMLRRADMAAERACRVFAPLALTHAANALEQHGYVGRAAKLRGNAAELVALYDGAGDRAENGRILAVISRINTHVTAACADFDGDRDSTFNSLCDTRQVIGCALEAIRTAFGSMAGPNVDVRVLSAGVATGVAGLAASRAALNSGLSSALALNDGSEASAGKANAAQRHAGAGRDRAREELVGLLYDMCHAGVKEG